MAFKQDANVPLVLTTGIISGVLLLVIVIGTQAWFESANQTTFDALADQSYNENPLRADTLKQKDKITKYGWVDQKNGVAGIPIDVAMQYVADHNGVIPATQPSTQPIPQPTSGGTR